MPEEVFVVLIKYMDIKDIVSKLMVLNKKIKHLIQSENYLLFKHFLFSFNLLNDRLKRSLIPARLPPSSLLNLFKDNLSPPWEPSSWPPSLVDLHPYAFYTDGGTYNDDTKYFINNIFSRSGVCYSSKVPKNTNVQCYIGRRVEVEVNKALPKDHKVKGSPNEILLPYAKYMFDQ